MAENQAVWGIEIGQAGLKAIKLQYAETAGQVLATAFDYVPHPKLLSQPDASPDELIAQALETFLSRNKVAGDTIAVSLPGQTALAKFIQLPPVESSKLAQIVGFEARQQIPYPLEEVIWDYQPIGAAGVEESGFLLDAEVGLFAMKRIDVEHHLRPFLSRKIEVELVQIAPLALHNFLCYDRMGIRLGEDAEPREDYTIVLDMGADTTTLLVTNGKKIWIRNVPLGGNHFTRALTREMKLTFAKAEHLKCNATKSPDPRAVFQALRPVFTDFVSEIQRSIGFFSSVNRSAKIGRVVGVGNGFKLAGLQKFLQQNLQYEVDRVDHFQALVGDQVLAAPLFQDNLLTFAVPYGLALQGLKLTDIHTSLLPPEIMLARKIRRKKPWAVAAAATLLAGLSASIAGYGNVQASVSPALYGGAETAASDLAGKASKLKADFGAMESANTAIKAKGDALAGSLKTRELWLEVYKAINDCLPRDVGTDLDQTDITKQKRISLNSVTCKRYADLSTWFNDPRQINDSAKLMMSNADRATAPSGIGYVFTLEGVHYHDDGNPATGQGTGFIRHYFLSNLQKWKVKPDGSNLETPVGQIGISHATITYTPPPMDVPYSPSGRPITGGGFGTPGAAFGGPGGGFGTPGGGFPGAMPEGALAGAPGGPGAFGAGRRPVYREEDKGSEDIKLIKQNVFTIQFAWKPTPAADRPEEAPAVATPEATGDQPAATEETPGEAVPGVGVAVPKAPATGRPGMGMPGGGGFGPAGAH